MKLAVKSNITPKLNPNPKSRSRFWTDVLRDYQLYIMILPVVIYYIMFHYVPLYGLQIAWKDYRPFLGVLKSEWVGWTHFINFFQSPYAWRVIRNSLVINIYDLAINFVLQIVFAIILNELTSRKFRTVAQTIMYMPYFVSSVVVAGLVITMLSPSSGIINTVIAALGGEKKYFLADPDWFRLIFTLMGTWIATGFNTIVYTSAICSIDESLYEAASIDGAGRFQKIWHITLPGIKSTIAIMLILKMGQMLTVGADTVLLLYQPATYETADVISTFVYRYGLEMGDYSYATAVGLFNGLIALVLVSISNKISAKVSESSVW